MFSCFTVFKIQRVKNLIHLLIQNLRWKAYFKKSCEDLQYVSGFLVVIRFHLRICSVTKLFVNCVHFGDV